MKTENLALIGAQTVEVETKTTFLNVSETKIYRFVCIAVTTGLPARAQS